VPPATDSSRMTRKAQIHCKDEIDIVGVAV